MVSNSGSIQLLFLLLLRWQLVSGKTGAQLLEIEDQGLDLQEHMPHQTIGVGGCSRLKCSENCGFNDSCSAAEFDAENLLCTMLFCSEIPLTNKKGYLVHIKRTISISHNENFILSCFF